MEDTTAYDALCDVAETLPQARIPDSTRDLLQVSTLTALKKTNNKVRGIAARDTFRRLVAKVLARQHQEQFRGIVRPLNFGLSNRSGTDSAVHLLQYLTDTNPEKSNC